MDFKTVELKDHSGIVSTYKIISTATFHIINSIDNNAFVVCDCELLKQ